MDDPQLGVFHLALSPERDCSLSSGPARLVHAALLRRLELVNPAFSAELHNTPASASSVEKPWTVSAIRGIHMSNDLTDFKAGINYLVRITGLTATVLQILDAAFDAGHPLGREPLILDRTPFNVVFEDTGWDKLTTYASLLTYARPIPELVLQFNSPCGFRTGSVTTAIPEPFRCIQGYLRKWNAFSPLPMQTEQLLEYVKEHISTEWTQLQPGNTDFRNFYERGWIGRVKWKAEGRDPFLLRMVNALANYAFYCGTGMKTTQGMGQTVRIYQNQ